MTQKLANKARSTLTGAITDVATSLTIQSGDADLFPVATTGTSAVGTAGLDWFKIVLEKNTGEYEIAYCRSRAAGVATLSNVIRGQEGTTAIAFSAGDVVGLRMTKTDIENALAGVFTGWSAVQVASAGTVDIGAQTTPVVEITGTTGITSLGTNYTAGPRFLRFTGALTITHNATSLICPGGANITTAAGMTMIAVPKSTAGTADGWVIEAVSTTTTASTTPVIVPSVAANAMTLALKTLAGADPTSTAPLSINFRDSTLASSTINTRQATAATSIVIPQNATLGGQNGLDAPIYVYGLDNGGTIELAVSGSNYGANFIGSTTAITSGSTSATTIYSTLARTSKPMKLLQILRNNQATAGTYTVVPVEVKYPDADPQNYVRTATAGGTADALTAAFAPPFPSLAMAAGIPFFVRPGAANATTTPTIAIDGLTAKTIVKGAGSALAAGDIAGSGHWLALQYDSTLDKVLLMNPANGITVPAAAKVGLGTKLTLTSDITGLTSAVAATIGWGSEAFDDEGLHDNVTNNSRITVGATARYRVTFCLSYEWDTGGTYSNLSRAKANLLKNGSSLRDWRGTTYYAPSSAWMDSGNVTRISMQGVDEFDLTSGDYLELQSLAIFGGSMKVLQADSFFLVERVKG